MPPVYNGNNYSVKNQNLQDLTNAISLQELTTTVKSWPSGKSPAPYDFPGEIYKIFLPIIHTD
jgi:hypothetical protein